MEIILLDNKKEMYKAYIQIFNIIINVHSWRDVEKRDDLMVKLMKG